jgi:hypothetical protein
VWSTDGDRNHSRSSLALSRAGRGPGQLYNREYKKGVILILVSAGILIWAVAWYYRAVQPFLPKDLTAIDPQSLGELLRNAAAQIDSQAGAILSFFKAAMTVLWLYGIIDAYRVADKKKKEANGRM